MRLNVDHSKGSNSSFFNCICLHEHKKILMVLGKNDWKDASHLAILSVTLTTD